MRILVWLCVAGIAASACAGVQPMSNKEIALMLRSGYSSDSALAEMSRRRVLEALDPATQKSLTEVGASPQLIAALDAGTFRITAEEAARLRRSASIEAQQTELRTQQTFRAATTILEKNLERRVLATPLWPMQVVRGLRNKLMQCRSGEIQKTESVGLESKKLVALYFSAHWCEPCRKFTPKLVDFYNRVAAQHPEFELIFISEDRSRFNWEAYLRDFHMPWPAVDFDQIASANELKKIAGRDIPSLVVLNSAGQIVSESYAGEKYLGPQKVVDELEKFFAGQPLAQSP